MRICAVFECRMRREAGTETDGLRPTWNCRVRDRSGEAAAGAAALEPRRAFALAGPERSVVLGRKTTDGLVERKLLGPAAPKTKVTGAQRSESITNRYSPR